jgi:membrane fusion protein (multidrug efflux system)
MQVDRLRALVDVPEKEILDLAVGGKTLIYPAPVRGESGPGLPGEIIHLSYGADPATRTYLAKIAMDNSDGTLLPGMIVQVAFSRRELTQVVAVPLYALVDRDGVKVVYVEQDGKALLRQVKVGPIIGSLAVIEEGLAPGAHLIVKGQHLVKSGASVVEEGN